MKLLVPSIVAIACLLLTACSSLTVPTPLGGAIDGPVAERFDGVWVTQDDPALDVLILRHTAADELRIVILEWDDDAKRFQPMQRDLLLGSADAGRLFVNIPFAQWDEETEEPTLDPRVGPFMPLLLDPPTDDAADRFVIYWPDFDAWAAAVDAGDLAGTVERSHDDVRKVDITADAESLAGFINGRAAEALFDMADGATAVRVADE